MLMHGRAPDSSVMSQAVEVVFASIKVER